MKKFSKYEVTTNFYSNKIFYSLVQNCFTFAKNTVTMDYKEMVKKGFALLSRNGGISDAEIATYFHPDYRQYVDGVELYYAGFVAHMKAQQKVVAEMNVSFKNIVQEGNTVFTNHVVDILKKDGGRVKIHLLAEFTIKDGKIIRCDELTRLVSGNEEDRDIGSRTH